MQEKFDQELIQRFRAVFGQYEDASADQGWKKLRERYPEPKKNRVVILYLLTLAASMLVVAFAWQLFNLKYGSHSQTIQSVSVSGLPHTQAQRTSKFDKKKESVNTKSFILNHLQFVSRDHVQPVPRPEFESRETSKTLSGHELNKSHSGQLVSRPDIESRQARKSLPGREFNKSHLGQPIFRPEISTDQTGTASLGLQIAISHRGEDIIRNGQPNSLPLFTAITVNQLPGSGSYRQIILIPTGPLNEKEPSQQITWHQLPDIGHSFAKRNRHKEKISIDAYTGSYLGYARGSDHHANIGGGIGSNIPLFGRLSLSTGLGLTPNNLYFAAGQNQQAAITGYAVTPKSTLLSASRSVNTEPQTNYSGYNAHLIGLDIPVNLQYMFDLGRKSHLYISTGVSSDLFLHEVYTYHYTGSDANSQLKAYDINQGSSTAAHPGSNLNLARLINLAVGISYPLGKQTSLSVEPFLKYPLKGIGSQQLHIGYGGINLKMSFTNKNKKH